MNWTLFIELHIQKVAIPTSENTWYKFMYGLIFHVSDMTVLITNNWFYNSIITLISLTISRIELHIYSEKNRTAKINSVL